jgi:hypothetical protein
MRKTICAAAAAVSLLATIAAVRAGGWAVVTVDNIPESVVAGRALTLDLRRRSSTASRA